AYQQQFDIGQRTLLDVLDSENEYFEASRAYANAQYDIALADARTLAAMGQLMQALGVMRDDMPSLAELGSDGVALDPSVVCPIDGPGGFTLADFTRGISAPAPTRAPDVTLSADALFAVNSAELGPDARQELAELAGQIRGRTDLSRVFIAGHADSTGTHAINDPLSQRRADSVADYLVGQGVDRGLIQTRGYGSRRPVASNDTVEGRRQNRRVEVTLERVGENLDMSSVQQWPAVGSQETEHATQLSVAEFWARQQPVASVYREVQGEVYGEVALGELAVAGQAEPQAVGAEQGAYLQVAALSDAQRAQQLGSQLSDTLARPMRLVSSAALHRIQLGPIGDPGELAALRSELKRLGYADSYVVQG
ncbi:MAG: OmpA family protein, partial [Billgrantia desiderata]